MEEIIIMKKKVLSLILASAMVASLAACGQSSETGTTETQTTATDAKAATESSDSAEAVVEAPADAVVIEVWSNDRHDEDYVRAKIDEYNSTNTDGIYINLTTITDDYQNMIQLAFTGGDAPDIVGANSLPLNTFADTGILSPLDDYIAADTEFQKVNEPYDNAFEGYNKRNGHIYSVYSGIRSGVRVEYNKNLLEENGYTEIPSNLSDYFAMAKAITEAGNGTYYGIGFTSSSPFERLLEMSAQVSGIYYYDYVNGKFDFSGYKPILEAGKQMIADGTAYPDQQGVDNMRALFQQGEFALWSNASQEAGVFTEQFPITDFEWGVAQVPSLDGEIKGALSMTPSKSYGIVSSTQHPEEAWKVISFFQSEDFLKGYLENGYCLPISNYMAGVIDSSKTGRLADFAKLDYEDVYPQPPLVNLTGDDYRTVLWNAVMGYVDIDTAIEDLNTRYNEALEADIASGSAQRLVIKDYDPLHPSAGTPEFLSE